MTETPSPLEFEKALLLDSRQNGIVGSITIACQLYEDNIRLRCEMERLKEIIKVQSLLLDKKD